MKKLVVVFVALTFLATFSLMGCNQSPAPPAKPAAEKGATWSPWSTRSTRSAWSARSARSASTRKEIDRDIRGITSPRGYTLRYFSHNGKSTVTCSVVPELTAISLRVHGRGQF